MSKRTYFPDRGDVVELNFFPSAGREIDKRRPAIVLSTLDYNRRTGLCLAVPATTDLTPGPFWISAPNGLMDRPSLVLCDHVKSFDYRERNVTFICKADKQFVEDIVTMVLNIIDPTFKI